MSQTTVKAKKWGSSLGVVIPSKIVKEEKLREGDEVVIEIRKKRTIKEVFGSMKGLKIDSQKMKDELRKEWSRW